MSGTRENSPLRVALSNLGAKRASPVFGCGFLLHRTERFREHWREYAAK